MRPSRPWLAEKRAQRCDQICAQCQESSPPPPPDAPVAAHKRPVSISTCSAGTPFQAVERDARADFRETQSSWSPPPPWFVGQRKGGLGVPCELRGGVPNTLKYVYVPAPKLMHQMHLLNLCALWTEAPLPQMDMGLGAGDQVPLVWSGNDMICSLSYRNTGSAEIRVTLTTSKITCALSEEGMIPAPCIFQRLYTRPSPLRQLD